MPTKDGSCDRGSLSAKLECAHTQAESFLLAQRLCGPGAAQSHPENDRYLLNTEAHS